MRCFDELAHKGYRAAIIVVGALYTRETSEADRDAGQVAIPGSVKGRWYWNADKGFVKISTRKRFPYYGCLIFRPSNVSIVVSSKMCGDDVILNAFTHGICKQ